MGRYFQENVDIASPIKWVITELNNGIATFVSENCVEYLQYDVNSQNKTATWENCSLRKWLNEDFFKKAFTEAEKKCVSIHDQDYTRLLNAKSQVFFLNDLKDIHTSSNSVLAKIRGTGSSRRSNYLNSIIKKEGSVADSLEWLMTKSSSQYGAIKSNEKTAKWYPVNKKALVRPVIDVDLKTFFESKEIMISENKRIIHEENIKLKEKKDIEIKKLKEKEKNDKMLNYRNNNLCQYCGGEFKGLFRKVCSQCGKKKDY